MEHHRIDIGNARVHFAARMIAYHVNTGASDLWQAFIAPPFQHPLFNHWFASPETPIVNGTHALVYACLLKWPSNKVQFFHSFAVTQLFARHNYFERNLILTILKEVYGFQIQFATA